MNTLKIKIMIQLYRIFCKNNYFKLLLFLPFLFFGKEIFAQADITVTDPVMGKAEIAATNSITLSPGFHAVEGCNFRAYIGTGNTTTNAYTLPAGQTVSGLPSSTKNYVRSITLREACTQASSVSSKKHLEEIQYFDGLGRPIQGISVNASPTGKDIIQHIKYDDFGRQEFTYLPYTESGSGGYRTDASSGLETFYNSSPTTGRTADTKYYTETEFDDSPLNRVVGQTGPGNAWHTQNKSVTNIYSTNTNSTYVTWTATSSGTYTPITYGTRTLFVTETEDEEGNMVREFTDKQGRVVRKETGAVGGTVYKTRYVYDDFGLLRCVVPPQATSPSQTDLCYYYTYDSRKRMIVKDLPGADPVYMVYDLRDRLVLTQDGKTRVEDNKKWNFIKYDKFNRPVMTGTIIAPTSDRSTIQTAFNNNGSNTTMYETYDGSTTYFGYTANSSYPSGYSITAANILTVTYYDNYSFRTNILASNAEYSNSTHNETGFSFTESSKTKGLVTGTMTKVLDVSGSGYTPADNKLFTISYYDDYGNVIRSISDNHLGGKDVISTVYKPITFEVEKTLQKHKGAGTSYDMKLLTSFDYDHTGRQLKTTQKVNSQDDVITSTNIYNELGEMVTNYMHSKDDGQNYLQKIDYQYNIRGWLTQINDPALTDGNDVFGMKLYYENLSGLNSLAPAAIYNGNIAGMKWGVKNDDVAVRGYGFDYDEFNRLTVANYADGSSLNQHTGYYDVDITEYDKNGNIKKLERKFNNTLVDNLTYTYKSNSNQLLSVADAGTASPLVDDYPGTSGTYAYDKNGNMDHDGGKNLDVGYNLLNLPQEVNFGNNNKLFYHYSASGAKLVKYNSVTTEKTHYVGNIVYNGTQIAYILTENGRLVPHDNGSQTVWLNEYNLKDHLGNTRAVIMGTSLGGAIDMVQHASYYPFGLAFGSGEHHTPTGTEYEQNKYLYNGKELQDDMFAGVKLGWYDYGARMYDAALGRFHTMDAYAEKYLDFSPYQYAANNPVLNIDINGDSIYTVFKDADGNKLDYVPDAVQKMFNSEYGISVGYNAETGMMYYSGEVETDQVVSASAKETLVGALSDTKTGRKALKEYGKITFGYDLANPVTGQKGLKHGGSNKTIDFGKFVKYREAHIDLADFDGNGNALYMKFQGVPNRAYNMGRVFEHEYIGHGLNKKGDGFYSSYHTRPGGAASTVNRFRQEMGLPLRLNYGNQHSGVISFGPAGTKASSSNRLIIPSVIKNPN